MERSHQVPLGAGVLIRVGERDQGRSVAPAEHHGHPPPRVIDHTHAGSRQTGLGKSQIPVHQTCLGPCQTNTGPQRRREQNNRMKLRTTKIPLLQTHVCCDRAYGARLKPRSRIFQIAFRLYIRSLERPPGIFSLARDTAHRLRVL
jgi:hypothetical protein